MKKWQAGLIIAAAVISTGVRAYYITGYMVRTFSDGISGFGRYDAEDFSRRGRGREGEPEEKYRYYEDDLEDEKEESGEEDFAEMYQRIEEEMQAVADYLYKEGALAGVAESESTDSTFTPSLDAKGWPYAVVYREETVIDGVKGYKVQTITYDYMRDYERQDEFVYEEDYYDENGNSIKDTQILDFFLVDRETMEVTDEHTTEWGIHAD